MDSLLKNAAISIRLGVEDYETANPERVLSSIRNYYAGVLLLCMEVLRRLSPPDSNDLLIKDNTRLRRQADGTIVSVGQGTHTIKQTKIVEYFKELGIQVDLSNLKKLSKIRNEIEHYYPSDPVPLMREAMATTFPVIVALCEELREKPERLLGAECWAAMLNEERLFQEQLKKCRSTFENMNWKTDTLKRASEFFICPNCSSCLVEQTDPSNQNLEEMDLRCTACGDQLDHVEVIETTIAEDLATERYLSVKDGDVDPLEECPECERMTYLLGEGCCVNPECEFALPKERCPMCGQGISLDDYRNESGGLCGSCHYRINRADD